MIHTIQDKLIIDILGYLHREASNEIFRIAKGLSKGIFRKLQPVDMEDTYIAIDQSQGAFIYDLLIKQKSKHIVEFGTSFGISTIYLGAAARANGGQVITTELLASKCAQASKNFEAAGLSDFILLMEGDAMETLRDIDVDIDFLLLDGWNDLYLPLLNMLEHKFKPGTMIYSDNASMKSAAPYIDYVRNSSKYSSQWLPHKGGAELTTYLGSSRSSVDHA